MHIQYKDYNFRPKTMEIIEHAIKVIDDFAAQGYTLTLRQLYYQFVKDVVIENSERSYKNLGTVINKARMAGMISWNSIEDRNRTCKLPYVCESSKSLITNLDSAISFDLWKDQDNYVEVWVEKEALGNVLERACAPFRLPYMSCKGYLSASEAWRAGQRFQNAIADGKNPVLIHLGDHDPSGVDMSRDNHARASLFADHNIEIRRIALTMEQIEQYNPPTNPAKTTDSRATGYIEKYGEVSWELDALTPEVIVNLVTEELEGLIDPRARDYALEDEETERRIMTKLEDNWQEVYAMLDKIED